jgi:hypothetical protein
MDVEEKQIDAENREQKKVPFETRIKIHSNGEVERKIFVDGVMLDYSVDITSFQNAVRMGPQYREAIMSDIVKHFTNCVSDMVGRKVTYDEVLAATKSGWI